MSNNSIESQSPLSWILAGPCFANKPTVLLWVFRNRLTPHVYRHPVNTTHMYDLYNVGPTSKTLGRRCINVIQMFCVCWEVGFSLNHFCNVGSMLGQRRRRWPNIKTALGECLVGVVSSLVIRLLHQPHCTVC